MNPLSWMLRGAIRSYQLLLRPVMAPSCRFEPSCSDYAMEALARHGTVRSVGLIAWRLLRCNPWGGTGYDPVPEATHSRRGQCSGAR